MELIFNARQLSRCPELPAGHGNYACWQKSTASSSEQRRNSRFQDGKTLEGLQARPDPVYEPMSVSRIFPFGKKNPVGLHSRNPAGFDSINLLMYSSQISRRIFTSCTYIKIVFGHRCLLRFSLLHRHKALLHRPFPHSLCTAIIDFN